MEDSLVHITYELQCEDPLQGFLVSLVVEYMDGEHIPVHAVWGDVNRELRAGKNKRITWNPAADGIIIDADLRVSVQASPVSRAEAQAPVGEDPPVQDEPVAGQIEGQGTYSRTGLMAQSALFPGWGLSRHTGKPHWIKGGLAYGCLAGSLALNRAAISTYEQQYLLADSESEASKLLSQAQAQDNISEILAYSALVIWISDLAWTLVQTRDLKKVSFTASLDPVSLLPMLGVVVQFPPGESPGR